jgi:hypothetical protein
MSQELKLDEATEQALLVESQSYNSELTEIMNKARVKNLVKLMKAIDLICPESAEHGYGACCIIYDESIIGTTLLEWLIRFKAESRVKIELKAEHTFFIVFGPGCSNYKNVPTYNIRELSIVLES